MGRADDIRARYEAELAMAEAEDRLIAYKARKRKDPEEFRAIKREVRALRQAHREQNQGGGTANPATINSSAGVKNAGGK